MEDKHALKARIDMLQMVYAVLFFASLIVLGANWMVFGHTPLMTGIWALTLGGAVVTRLYRTSLVNKYNQLVSGGDGPLT